MSSSTCESCGQPRTFWIHLEHARPHELTFSQQVALAVYDDVLDRRGIKNAFREVDDEVIQSILEDWARLHEALLSNNDPNLPEAPDAKPN